MQWAEVRQTKPRRTETPAGAGLRGGNKYGRLATVPKQSLGTRVMETRALAVHIDLWPKVRELPPQTAEANTQKP